MQNTLNPNLPNVLWTLFGIDPNQVAAFLSERLSVLNQIDSFTGVSLGYSETAKLLILLKETKVNSDCSLFELADLDLIIEYHGIDPIALKAELRLLIDEEQWPLPEIEDMHVYYAAKIAAYQVQLLSETLDWPSKFKIPNP